jgi:hypothetical protein
MFFRVVRAIWIALVLAGTFIGLLYMPKDVSEAEEALKSWRELMPLDRETFFIIFSGICLVYIFWRDFHEKVFPIFAHKFGLWKDRNISITDIVGLAKKKYNWMIFEDSSLQILDLLDGLGEAIGTGKITAYGLHNPENRSNLHIIYPRRIPLEHWHEHHFDGFDAVRLNDNLLAISKPRRGDLPIKVYMDIRLDRQEVRKWLSQEADRWKGLRDKEEAARRKRIDAFYASITQQEESRANQSHEGTEEGTQP